MKRFFKYFAPYAAMSAVVIALLLLLGNPILRTLSNAMIGEQWGKIIAGYAMGLILPTVLFAVFHLWRARNERLRRDYLNAVRDIPFVAKEDSRLVRKSTEFRMELIGIAIISLLLAILYMPLYIIVILLFIPFDLWSWRRLHKAWIKEKNNE